MPLGAPNDLVEKIIEVPIDGEGKDTARWNSTAHGDFSTSSAWEIIRHQQEKMEIFRLIWSPALSPSMSIFIWRLLANRVPMDAKLQWRSIHLASKCKCCKNSSEETREHLFIQGATMAKIWRYFANWFPDAPEFPRDMTNIELRIRWWKSNAMQTTKEHVNILIPCLILWFIWTERNNVIH